MTEYDIIKSAGKTAYQADDTRNWVEPYRVNGMLKPNFVLRFATDTNYVYNQHMVLPAYERKVYTQSIMNLTLPGMRVPHVLNWQVQESIENEVSSGSFEIINGLSVSSVTAELTSALTAERHSKTINASYVQGSLLFTKVVEGDVDVSTIIDRTINGKDIYFNEDRLRFRQFECQSFEIDDPYEKFPNPAIRIDDDNDIRDDRFFNEAAGFQHLGGVGSYYVKINNEIIRVVGKLGSEFFIPPGGRGINGILEAHSIGDTVTLLGFGPPTGEVTGIGMFSLNPYSPQRSPFRPGTALVSYEGYGELSSLEHAFDASRNYQFTGYWFVDSVEESLGEDGVAKLRISVEGPASMLTKQQVTIDTVQRIGNNFGTWKAPPQIGEEDPKKIFSDAGHTRDIPGDWVDYNSWDSSIKGAYPLQVKTEYAQHKEYFDHMKETNLGKDCLQCRKEKAEWEKLHKEKKGNTSNANKLNRAIGRHIYKKSIRVLREEGGPLKTYIRLLNTIAMAAWDNPPQGLELGQRFTKIPNKLYDNMRNIETGLLFNGQPTFNLSQSRNTVPTKDFDWSSPGFSEYGIVYDVKTLTAPFESSYDKSSFSQPGRDLAEVNGSTYWINREGYPVFAPANWILRPFGGSSQTPTELSGKPGYRDLAKTTPYTNEIGIGEWFLSYGGSIHSYQKNIDPSGIITQTRVSCQTAFEEGTFTIASAGTGSDKEGYPVFYGGRAGNKLGLALTGGVQQVDTLSLENLRLGLDWNTKPAAWGVQENRDGDIKVLEKRPDLYNPGGKEVSPGGSISVNKYKNLSQNRSKDWRNDIKKIQNTINFFLTRKLIDAHRFDSKKKDDNNQKDDKSKGTWVYELKEDGEYGEKTAYFVKALSKYLKQELLAYNEDKNPEDPAAVIPSNEVWNPNTSDGETYSRYTYRMLDQYFTFFKQYLINDPVWWAYSDRTWTEYVAHIVGLPVAMKNTDKGTSSKKPSSKEKTKVNWVVDEKATQKNVENWMKQFHDDAVKAGARKVDMSIEKSVQRTIQSNIADPRIQPGDIIWVKVPGLEKQYDDRSFLPTYNQTGSEVTPVMRYPHTSGMYVTSISRQIDLQSGAYTASYSGHLYKGLYGRDFIDTKNKITGYLT